LSSFTASFVMREVNVDRRLTTEDINWLCKMRIARQENLTLRGVPPSVVRRLTMLHCAQVIGQGQYSITLRGRDELVDRDLENKFS